MSLRSGLTAGVLVVAAAATPQSAGAVVPIVPVTPARSLGLAPGAPVAPPVGSAQRGRWLPPVRPVRVVHRFDEPAGPYAPGHRGVDLAAGAGAVVRAPVDGVVSFAGLVAGRPVLTLRHTGSELDTTYEPVAAGVPVGGTVRAGEVLGTIVASPADHCSPAACLHWGARRQGRYVDPMLFLSPPRIVLKTPTR